MTTIKTPKEIADEKFALEAKEKAAKAQESSEVKK